MSWPLLVCPTHRSTLKDDGALLRCDHGHTFPVVNEIPRLVPDDSYARAFAVQWNRHRRTQLDSYTGTSISARRLRPCIGDMLWHRLPTLTILECGCGAGRFTEILLAEGARVYSVDLSAAVDANRENCPISERHRIIQADLTRLPFEPHQFDVVMCLGVLQHTPDPERSIAALYDHVAPGGWLIIDHYRRRLTSFLSTRPPLRAVLKRLRPEQSTSIVDALVRGGLPIRRAFDPIPVVRSIIGRLIPIASYYRTFPELRDDLQAEWSRLDTYDALTDWYKHTRTLRQIRAALEEVGAVNISCWYGGNGIEAEAQKPTER